MTLSEPQHSNELILRGDGTDCLWNLIQDEHIRPLWIEGVLRVPMADVIHTFRRSIKNPRQYWKDQKRNLLAIDWEAKVKTPDPELVANLYRLKLTAADGKKYLTDMGSLWLMVYVGGRLNQTFYKHITKFYTMAQLKYRVHNIERGAEWAAEYVRSQMVDDEPPDYESPYADMGYIDRKADRFAPPDNDSDRYGRQER